MDRAEKIAREILKKNPDSARAYTILGRIKYCRGRKDPAGQGQNLLIASMALLSKAMENEPTLFEARFFIAETAIPLKQYDFALMMAKHFQEERPGWPYSYIIPIQVAVQRNDYKELLRLCLDFQKRFDDKKSYQYLVPRLLTAYKGLNRLDDAEAVHLKLIRDNEGEAWPLAFYAEFLIKDRKDYDKAMEQAQKAMAMTDQEEPKFLFAGAAVAKGVYLYRSKNQPEKAEKYYEKALEVYPDHIEGWKQYTILNYELAMKNQDGKRLNKAMVGAIATKKIGYKDPAWDEYLEKMAKEIEPIFKESQEPQN